MLTFHRHHGLGVVAILTILIATCHRQIVDSPSADGESTSHHMGEKIVDACGLDDQLVDCELLEELSRKSRNAGEKQCSAPGWTNPFLGSPVKCDPDKRLRVVVYSVDSLSWECGYFWVAGTCCRDEVVPWLPFRRGEISPGSSKLWSIIDEGIVFRDLRMNPEKNVKELLETDWRWHAQGGGGHE